MNKKITFVLFTSIIVISASFFASSFPDGLEYIAEKLGFLNNAVPRLGIMSDYSVGFIGENSLSTSIAGLFGIALIMSIFAILIKLTNKQKKEN